MAIVLVGATSGSITLQEPAIAGSTVLNLPTGTGTILSSGAPQSGGVIQVVNAITTTQASSSSSIPSDTTLTATITPKFATSKILVLVDHADCYKFTNNTGIIVNLLRNSTNILTLARNAAETGNTNTINVGSISCCYVDSPATTSATTYKTQFASRQNNAIVSITYDGSASTITLMEIAA